MSAGFAPGFARCPQCQLSVEAGRTICPACGSLLPLEAFMQNARSSFRQALWRPGSSARLGALVLWLLACVPLLIVPPLLALGLGFLRGIRTAQLGEARYTPYVAAIAVTNIALSVAFWIYAGQHLSQAITQIAHWISLHNPFDLPAESNRPQYI